MSKKAALIVLDGLGIAPKGMGNAVTLAKTPFLDSLFDSYPHTKLEASGEAVGLEKGQMGDSNVGHLNLGAGRVVWQILPQMNKAISQGALNNSSVLKEALIDSEKKNRPVHLMGLVSDGGVHSHMNVIRDFLEVIKDYKVSVYIHAFLDGRDVSPKSSIDYIDLLETWINEYSFSSLATVSGRYYAMDRDKRWDRTELALNALMKGQGKVFQSGKAAIEDSYKNGITDEFVIPSIVNSRVDGRILPEDNVIFFNFRADRARQITKRMLEENVKVIGMTHYDDNLAIPIIFPPQEVKNTLAEWLSKKGKTQLHIAETEKYAHVTFFFNGGKEVSFEGEERILINSPKVATYDMQPEMSADEVTDEAIHAISENMYDFVILNYANCDMVGHTGDISAAIKAVEAVDKNLGRLVTFLKQKNYQILITADHGNAEQMIVDGKPHTAHTSNLVPLIAVTNKERILKNNGKLGDIAPTILDLMEIDKPSEMTGNSLIS
jgi:2,3-bisphosphoglycerate-independent phosphoglycerate mutase